MGALRNELGADLGLIEPGYRLVGLLIGLCSSALVKVDSALSIIRFTQPTCTPDELKADPEAAKAAAYDVVVNGYELRRRLAAYSL